MARQLAESTLKRFRKALDAEREQLEAVIAEFERQLELARLAETSSEHAPDPDSADGGSLALEMEMDMSRQQNAQELLHKVMHAYERMDQGVYGICEVTGEPIPVARLDALPYATTLVEWADRV